MNKVVTGLSAALALLEDVWSDIYFPALIHYMGHNARHAGAPEASKHWPHKRTQVTN